MPSNGIMRFIGCATTLVVTACGSSVPTPPVGAPTATAPHAIATPTPVSASASPAVAIEFLTESGSAFHIVTTSGTVAAIVPVPSDGSSRVGTGSGRIWVEQATTLTFFDRNGKQIAAFPFTDTQLSSAVVFSPDGAQWMWTAHSGVGTTPGPTTTTLYLGSAIKPMTVIGTHSDPDGSSLQPLRWVGSSVYMTERQVVGGGRIVYAAADGAYGVDVGSHAVMQMQPSSCQLQDVAADTTLMCLSAQTVTFFPPSGPSRSVTFGTPGTLDPTGAGAFSPDGMNYIVAGESTLSTGVTFTGAVASGTPRRLADSEAPMGYTSDGRAVVVTYPGTGPGTVTFYRADGSATAFKLPDGDAFLALIDAGP